MTAALSIPQLNLTNDSKVVIFEDEFLNADDLIVVTKDAAKRSKTRVLSEITEMIREKKWNDIIALFYPVEEKLPELLKNNMDLAIREKLAFAMGQVQKFDQAIVELQICIKKDPENFYTRSSLAYTAYNSLYAVKNKEIFLAGEEKKKRIEIAHENFKKAQHLRPDGVTNFYREGMLYKELENKSDKALPLFQQAASNWNKLTEAEKTERHQERKNYVKAVYRFAACLMEKGMANKALVAIQNCLKEDEKTDYVSKLFKYFALGKANFHSNNFPEARNALLFATKCGSVNSSDYVYELLGRTYLALDNLDKALEIIGKVPEKFRRPYYRWTEADILCKAGEYDSAKQILTQSAKRDGRSRHKSLMRVAKIEYLLRNYQEALKYARQAGLFFQNKWGNIYNESLFWEAVSNYRLGNIEDARHCANKLNDIFPLYPNLSLLRKKLNSNVTILREHQAVT